MAVAVAAAAVFAVEEAIEKIHDERQQVSACRPREAVSEASEARSWWVESGTT